jgi:hypothetical protein
MFNTNHGKQLADDVDNFEGRYVNIQYMGTTDDDRMYKGKRGLSSH